MIMYILCLDYINVIMNVYGYETVKLLGTKMDELFTIRLGMSILKSKQDPL